MDGWADGNAEHELAGVYPAGRCWFVSICRCGWSSELCGGENRAKDRLREHIRAEALAVEAKGAAAL